jgi:glycosyltransferase involved in cell wall biosynthesis
MPPTFSIIVPTYNRPEWLRGALGSVLAQDYFDFECIVVDDGGDERVEVPSDPRFRVIRHDVNRGLAAALNTGIEAAQADWVTFLDDDDELMPDRLSMMLDSLGAADVLLCWAAPLEGDPRPQWNRELEGNVHDVILDTWAPSVNAALVRREAIPCFDERYQALEDLEWWIRASRTLRFATVTRIGYLVRIHSAERNRNGPVARIEFGQTLLDAHRDYFRAHRRAEAFRWHVIGLLAMQLGDRQFARRAFVRSLRIYPMPKRFGHLALTLRRSTYHLERVSSGLGDSDPRAVV